MTQSYVSLFCSLRGSAHAHLLRIIKEEGQGRGEQPLLKPFCQELTGQVDQVTLPACPSDTTYTPS